MELIYYLNYFMIFKDMLSICLASTTTFSFILISIFVLGSNYLLIKIGFILIYLIFISSYIYTVLINPGIPSKQYYIPYFKNKNIGDIKNWKKCSKCQILIPKTFKAIHCDICQVCVREHDHHCPWTGKCIGKYNLMSFYIFVNSLMTYIIMIFVAIYGYMFYTMNMRTKKKYK